MEGEGEQLPATVEEVGAGVREPSSLLWAPCQAVRMAGRRAHIHSSTHTHTRAYTSPDDVTHRPRPARTTRLSCGWRTSCCWTCTCRRARSSARRRAGASPWWRGSPTCSCTRTRWPRRLDGRVGRAQNKTSTMYRQAPESLGLAARGKRASIAVAWDALQESGEKAKATNQTKGTTKQLALGAFPSQETSLPSLTRAPSVCLVPPLSFRHMSVSD